VDLSFSRFDRAANVSEIPAEFAMLLVGVSARQATSPTALLQQRQPIQPLPQSFLAPGDGAFNSATAALIAAWKYE